MSIAMHYIYRSLNYYHKKKTDKKMEIMRFTLRYLSLEIHRSLHIAGLYCKIKNTQVDDKQFKKKYIFFFNL